VYKRQEEEEDGWEPPPPGPEAPHGPAPLNPSNNCVAVGLASGNFPLEGYMPGWDASSYAFHSDDGGIFHGTGIKVSATCRPLTPVT
jgi:hypothetical protein